MAITTLAQVRTGLQIPQSFVKGGAAFNTGSFLWHTTWPSAILPGAGSYDTTLNGVALTSPVAGQIPFSDPPSGNAYLARFVYNNFRASQSLELGGVLLCDRLWHNGGYDVTSTSAQNSTTPTWPARDEDGATSGKGVLLALEISATVGAATPNISVSYTNSAGTSGRTAAQILSATVSASVARVTYLLDLQAGDVGVKSVESLTLSASWISGTMNLVAYRPIVLLTSLSLNRIKIIEDAITLGLPRLYAGSVPYLMLLNATTVGTGTEVHGELGFAFG